MLVVKNRNRKFGGRLSAGPAICAQNGVAYGMSAVNSITPHIAGAVDILMVQQPDGSRKCSPFYGEIMAPLLVFFWVWVRQGAARRIRERKIRLASHAKTLALGIVRTVRFGKYTPLRTKERHVKIYVNGEAGAKG